MSDSADIACLIFVVNDHQFGISSDMVYRIERFDKSNVQFKDNRPAFYHVGDYVITLDWLLEGNIKKENLTTFDRLILYRNNGKIRGIPATSLVRVQNCSSENLSLVPVSFRSAKKMKWIKLFIVNQEPEEIIPVLGLDYLENFISDKKRK